jgi:hypothetical protein
MTILLIGGAARRLITVFLTLRAWLDSKLLVQSGYPPYFSVPIANLGDQVAGSDWRRFLLQPKVLWRVMVAACIYAGSFWITLRFL